MSQAEDETQPLEDHDVIATYTSRHVDAETQLLEVLEDYLPHPLHGSQSVVLPKAWSKACS